MRLLSSLIVDRLILNLGERPQLSLQAETLGPGTELKTVTKFAVPNAFASVRCCIVESEGALYLAVEQALQNATTITGQTF
jgi:hypothetical protein